MPNIVFDASFPIGALLKTNSVPERALFQARSHASICPSQAIEQEIRKVFARPKFRRYLTPDRAGRILDLIVSGAVRIEPTFGITDCRDTSDNTYLELALAAQADTTVAGGDRPLGPPPLARDRDHHTGRILGALRACAKPFRNGTAIDGALAGRLCADPQPEVAKKPIGMLRT